MNRETFPLCIAFAILFALCYGGAAWIASQYPTLPAWDFAFEHRIPFVPSLAIVYLTITPALLLAPLYFRTRSELAPLFAALCAETLIATAFFLWFPQKTAFVRPEVTGWARGPFEFADAMNLDFNEFPSLHVAFAVSLAWAYRGRVWIVWAGAVAISAWLIYEHHLIDIAGGIALAAIVMPVALRERTWVELCCLWQCACFSRRHVRYFVIFLAIWGPSLLHWRRYRAVRYGFCAAQWIDDLLDGDRPSDREPLQVVGDLIAKDFSGNDSLSRLTRAFLAEVDEHARREFIALVRTMQRDRMRVLEGAVWPEEELAAHHRETFTRSVNLMLITSGCSARANDVPSLIHAFAWCSVFRDLDDDLRKGLINVPRHAWQTAAYDEWTRNAHREASDDLARSAREIERLEDPASRRILRIFQKSIARFASTADRPAGSGRYGGMA